MVAKTVDELDDVIDAMVASEKFFLADIRVNKEENCFPMIPSGAAHFEMLLGPSDGPDLETSEEGKILV